MADRFTIDQFAWLRQVAFDTELPATSSRVAIALTDYFSRKHGGWAWMSQSTLMQRLDMKSDRTVRTALSALVERGHLIRKRRGKEETNLYRLNLKNTESDRQKSTDHDRQESTVHEDGVTGKNAQSDRQKSAKVTGKNLPTNPLKEPSENPLRGKHPKVGDSIPRTRRRRVQIPWPDGFHLSDELADHAEAKAGWDLSRAFAEFERFQNYHVGKGNTFADWNAAWRMWVMNGVRFDRERTQQQGAVIDNDTGKVVNFPGAKQQQRSPYRRRSNTDLAFAEDGDDE